MAGLSSTAIVGFVSSGLKLGEKIVEYFVSGFTGHGWKIWEYIAGKWKLEIDTIVVRETMVVFELLIQKIRAVKGALNITQASGKIKTAVFDETEQVWLITIEDEMSFVTHDIVRCQDWSKGTINGYWVEISEIRNIEGVDTIVIPVSEFTGGIGYENGLETVKVDLAGMSVPALGDEIVQFGNSVNVNRQSAIYLHADEGGQPAIDILFGIKSKSFVGCVKQRIGGDIPGTDGLKGFYCENGMIKGVDETGHTVYCIYPDGSAEFGDGSVKFNTDRSGHIAGGAIEWEWDKSIGKHVCTMKGVVLKWENLDDEAKEQLKGESGKDANLLPWIEEWNEYATTIGEGYIVTPKMFSGAKTIDANGKILMTGIVQGKDCLTDADGNKRTGIFALVENEIVFSLDPDNKEYKFRGKFTTADKGARIELNPLSKNIRIFDDSENEVAAFEGVNRESINDLFKESTSVINVKNIPYSLEFKENYNEIIKEVEISDGFKTFGLTIIDFTYAFSGHLTPNGNGLIDINIDVYTYSVEDHNVFIRKTNLVSDFSWHYSYGRPPEDFYLSSNSIQSLYLGEGYHIIKFKIKFNRSMIAASLSFQNFDCKVNPNGNISNFFANGIVLGTSNINHFGIINRDYDGTKYIEGSLINPNYGVELKKDSLLSKRNGFLGMIPGVVCCGHVSCYDYDAGFVKYKTFDDSKLSVNKLSPELIPTVEIKFPESWSKFKFTDNAYVILTGFLFYTNGGGGTTTQVLTQASFYSFSTNGFYVKLSNNSNINEGEFFFEVKWY